MRSIPVVSSFLLVFFLGCGDYVPDEWTERGTLTKEQANILEIAVERYLCKPLEKRDLPCDASTQIQHLRFSWKPDGVHYRMRLCTKGPCDPVKALLDEANE